MRKLLILIFASIVLVSLADNNKDEKVKFRDTSVVAGDMKVSSDGAFANGEFVKTKIIIENKNDFFVLLDPNRSFFYANGAKFPTKEREIVIPPSGKKSKVFDVKGKGLNIQALSIVIDGFTRTGNEKTIEFPGMAVKNGSKESASNIEIIVADVDYDKANRLNLRLKIRNTGNDVLIINSGVVELNENGNPLNNIRKRSNRVMLRKGESEVVAVSFQTSGQNSEKKIVWNDALLTASLLPMDPMEIGLGTTSDALKDHKYFLQPAIPKKPEPAIKKDEPVAMNNSRAKETKKKETKPAAKPAAKTKTETPKKADNVKRSEIASEGDMSELHAAEVNFGDAGGKYYALLIGCSNYNDPAISDLGGLPTSDAEALGKVLKNHYTFAPENVKVLKDPTRRDIVIALDDLSKTVTNNDNVLIFYAGHGHYEDDNDIGYWLPKDAEVSNSANWLYNDQLVASMRKIKSLHTLLIADACFSGSIFKNRSISLTGASDVVKKKYQLPSRKAITSGTLKTVPNKSVFIKYLLDRLEKNKEKYFPAGSLYRAIEEPVGNNSTSLPQYGVINNVGDEGGDFIFIKK